MPKQKDARNAPPAAPDDDPNGIYVSGKLVISAVVVLALAAAGFSWWFRYTSTRQAARFWGPDNVALIRDAPFVELLSVGPMAPDEPHDHSANPARADHFHTLGGVVQVRQRRDVSHAPGLAHLRNELLMDRSVQPDRAALGASEDWRHGLEFRSSPDAPPMLVLFSANGRRILLHPPFIGAGLAAASDDFAQGLVTVLSEWDADRR